MSYDPPDTQSLLYHHYPPPPIDNMYPSPLLQTTKTTHKPVPLSLQKRFNSTKGGNVHNRLGSKNSYSNGVQDKNRNKVNMNNQRQEPNKNFFKRRTSEPVGTKSKWKKQWQPYSKSPNNQYNNSVQNRLNRIRSDNKQFDEIQAPRTIKQVVPNDQFNESQEMEATDITVEVVNHNAHLAPPIVEEAALSRFKMVLNPKTQAAIKLLQQNIKNKQVIFPFPVTPNVTAVSLHERFTML